MTNSAGLKESDFSIFPRIVLCEEASHLEMYYGDEGSGPKQGVGGLFRTNFGNARVSVRGF